MLYFFSTPISTALPLHIQLHQHSYTYKANGLQVTRSVVPEVCSVDPSSSVTYSQRIRGYISLTATLQFTYFLYNE